MFIQPKNLLFQKLFWNIKPRNSKQHLLTQKKPPKNKTIKLFTKNESKEIMFSSSSKIIIVKKYQQELKIHRRVEKFAKETKKYYQIME